MREYTQLEAGDEHRGDLYSPVFTAPWIWNRVPMGKRIPLSYSSWNILPRVSIAALVFCLVGIGAAPGLLPADEPTIEISDVLDITVKNEPDLSVSRQVEESGTFSYPLLREIEAAGRTPSELARQIEKRLYDEEYLWKPKVTVEIKDRPGHVIRVIGEVRDPGQSEFVEGMRLRDAIEKHGGILQSSAGPGILLQGRGRIEPVEIDRHLLYSKGPAGKVLDFLLRPGDEIVVKPAQEFFILGIDEKPQALALTHHYTLSQVLYDSLLSSSGDDGWVVIRRAKEHRQESVIDLRELADGNRMVDLTILPGDRVYVVREGFFYVGGEVDRPGLYAFSEGATIEHILKEARPTLSASEYQVSIRRGEGGETVQYSPEDFQTESSRDLPISDRDIILVMPK